MRSMTLLATAVILLGVCAPQANAEDVLHIRMPAWETNRACASPYSQEGAELSGLGVITAASGRLVDLELGDLWTVNTAAVLSGAMVTDFFFGEDLICRWTAWTTYEGGVLRIYDNVDANVVWTDPGTFSDGTLLLEIEIDHLDGYLHFDDCAHQDETTISGAGAVTGGSLLMRFPELEREIEINGLIDLESMDASTACSIGCFGFLELDLAVIEAVPVERSSWGRLKRLY